MYLLGQACELQCIQEIRYSKKRGSLELVLCKYKAIKNFNEYEKIVKRCRL
jgi:hypothetical protein